MTPPRRYLKESTTSNPPLTLPLTTFVGFFGVRLECQKSGNYKLGSKNTSEVFLGYMNVDGVTVLGVSSVLPGVDGSLSSSLQILCTFLLSPGFSSVCHVSKWLEFFPLHFLICQELTKSPLVQGGDHWNLLGQVADLKCLTFRTTISGNLLVRMCFHDSLQYLHTNMQITFPPWRIPSVTGLVLLRPPRFPPTHFSCRLSVCVCVCASAALSSRCVFVCVNVSVCVNKTESDMWMRERVTTLMLLVVCVTRVLGVSWPASMILYTVYIVYYVYNTNMFYLGMYIQP